MLRNLKRYSSVLVLLEHNKELVKGSLSTITAAMKLNPTKISAVVFGESKEKIGQLDELISVKAEQIVEEITPVLLKLQKENNYSHVIALNSQFGKNLIPRLAAVLDTNPISDVIEIIDEKTFKRPIYAGNAITTVESSDKLKLLTIRQSAFEVSFGGEKNTKYSTLEAQEVKKVKKESEKIVKSERPKLEEAKIIVSGGRALKSKENFDILYKLADKLNGAVGATRAAVDAEYVSNDLQIGQTGKIVAPELYFAVGISGAIQHIAGMKDSKVIVAVNKDADAPIFQVCDYGLVGDLFKIVPEITEKI